MSQMSNQDKEKEDLLELVRKSSPPPFLLKTFMLVEDPKTDEIISWNVDGTAFVVWQPAEFSRDLLPTLFKHSNFSSFVRQLNTYGFRKLVTSRWEFYNEMFRKGKTELLCKIRRRKAWEHKSLPMREVQITPQEPADEDRGSSSTSSSGGGYDNLLDENKRLKRENGILSSELTCMKKKCKELLDLVAVHGSCCSSVLHGDEEEEEEEEDQRPKLFGVRLEVQGDMVMRKKRRLSSADVQINEKEIHIMLSQSCK